MRLRKWIFSFLLGAGGIMGLPGATYAFSGEMSLMGVGYPGDYSSRSEVMDLFDEAIAKAEEISDPEAKARFLRDISADLAKVDVLKAVEIAEKIPYEVTRSWAFYSIAGEAVKEDTTTASGLFARAIAQAEKVKEPYAQASLFGYMAVEMAKLNRERALQLIDRCVKLLDRVPNSWEKERLQIGLAEQWASLAPPRALALLRTVHGEELRAPVLAKIETEMAKRNSGSARKLLQDFLSNFSYSLTLREFIKKQAQVDPKSAIALVIKIREAGDMDQAIRVVALEVAKTDLNDALRWVDEIKRPDMKAKTLSSLAVLMAKVNPSRAIEIFEQAISYAKKIVMPNIDFNLIEVGVDLTRVDRDRGMEIIQEAFQRMEKLIGPPYDKNTALTFVSTAMKLKGVDPERALKLMKWAIDFAREQADPSFLARIAALLWQYYTSPA